MLLMQKKANVGLQPPIACPFSCPFDSLVGNHPNVRGGPLSLSNLAKPATQFPPPLVNNNTIPKLSILQIDNQASKSRKGPNMTTASRMAEWSCISVAGCKAPDLSLNSNWVLNLMKENLDIQ